MASNFYVLEDEFIIFQICFYIGFILSIPAMLRSGFLLLFENSLADKAYAIIYPVMVYGFILLFLYYLNKIYDYYKND